MKIEDYKELICALPFEDQAFLVKKEIWKNILGNSNHVENIFEDNNSIKISRKDLFNETNIETFIIKVLMWGYPSGGRGNNIKQFLKNNNKIKEILENRQNLSFEKLKNILNESKGAKLSTISKLLYFKKILIDGFNALILDQKVINSLNIKEYKDEGIEKIEKINYDNAIKHYYEYLRFLNRIANKINAKPDQIEMFLFEFGTNLKNY